MKFKVVSLCSAHYFATYSSMKLDPNRMHADIVEFKVGRSYKPIQRVGQWENSCRSQNHIVRYIFPPPPNQIMLAGMMRQGDPAKFCHRLERLIHLELADLSLHGPYLHEADKDSVLQLSAKPRTHCVDCERYFLISYPSNIDRRFKVRNSIKKSSPSARPSVVRIRIRSMKWFRK